jgi:hypothetical protein
MRSTVFTRGVPTLLLAGALTACGDDETAPEETHTPTAARVFVDDVDATDNLVLPADEVVRVEVRFYDDEDEEITGIDDDHFATLTFTPSTLAEVADVSGEHFQKDVTGGAEPGTGTFTVGYGHDDAADDLTFGPYDASVVVTGGVTR